MRHGAITDDVAQTIQAKKTGGHSLNYMPTAMVPRTHRIGASDEYAADDTASCLAAQEDVTAALRAEGEHSYQFIKQKMEVRRLTPREDERLQGWKEMEQHCLIEVRSDDSGERREVGVPAGMQCLIPQSNAGNAESIKWIEHVSFADNDSPSSNPRDGKPVVLDAVIDLGASVLELRSDGELLSRVKSAENNTSSKSQKATSDFVHLGARISTILARTIRDGREASPGNGMSSCHPARGSACVRLYGREIAASVDDAGRSMSEAVDPSKSITSEAGSNFLPSDLSLPILCSSVIRAISGYIPEPIKGASSYDISLTLISGHTQYGADGTEMSDSARYKMCGNGVAAPVAAWIARRIAAVTA